MSFLDQTKDQAKEAFTGMPMQSRIIAIMLVGVIAIGLAYLVRDGGTTKKDILFGGQSFAENDLAAIEVAFSRAGLSGWEREGRRIRVPSESKAEYLAALEDSATLPMALRSSVQEALNAMSVFDSSDLMVARASHAKAQDLGHKIGTFPEVRWAAVEYDRGERRGLSRSRPQSASVVVQPEGTSALSRQKVLAIKELVRGSYAGMSSDDVVVIDTNSTSSSSLVDDDDPILRKQREVEGQVEQKVRGLLAGYPGARVGVSAEIDPTMDTRKTVVKFDAEPTNLTSKSRKTEITSSRAPNGGVPGTGPNAITNRAVSLENPAQQSKTKEDERETTGVAGQQYEDSRVASLQVTKVRVSVGLPVSYYESVFQRDALRKDPETAVEDLNFTDTELEKLRAKTERDIRSAVTVLLPEVSAGANPDPLVTVWDYPDLPQAEAPGPDTVGIALTWLAGSWQTIVLVMLAFVALLVARSAAKGTGDSSPPEFAEGFGLELPAPPPEPEMDEEDSDSMTITGDTLKDELLEIVESNPEVAANVIRGWVGEAA